MDIDLFFNRIFSNLIYSYLFASDDSFESVRCTHAILVDECGVRFHLHCAFDL